MDINEAAIRHLANRSRSELEMKQHLLKKGFDKEEVLLEIENLKAAGYINDAAYAEEYIRYALGKGRAIGRIRRELALKGVGDFDFEDGLYAYEEENQVDVESLQVEAAMAEAEKLMRNADVVDQKLLAKIGRRLNSLGYGSGLIYKTLDKCKRELDEIYDGDF